MPPFHITPFTFDTPLPLMLQINNKGGGMCPSGYYILQVPVNNPGALKGVQFVVLDEVHERSMDSDLLLLLLKLLSWRWPCGPYLWCPSFSFTLFPDINHFKQPCFQLEQTDRVSL
jgi:hypothetical protein